MRYLSILLIFLSFKLTAQNLKEAKKVLKAINTVKDIEQAKALNSNLKIYHSKHTVANLLGDSTIINAEIGDELIKYDENKTPISITKIISKQNEELCKVKYILLDRNIYSTQDQIDSLQDLIISQFNQGRSFESLHEEYNIDGNPDGNFGWFYRGMAVKEFDVQVRAKKKGDFFKLNVHEKGWYYVVLKTHEDTDFEVTSVITIYLKR